MELKIEINKKFFTNLKPHAIVVLIYSLAYYEKNGKIASMNHLSKELKMGYLTIRKSLSEIFLFLNSSASSHRILYNRFSFILASTERISHTYTKYMSKKDDQEELWYNIVNVAKDYYSDSVKSYSTYYWRIGVNLKKLIGIIGFDNLQKYIDWYFKVKAPLITYFNPSVFCHDNIIKDFKVSYMKIKTRQVEIERGYEKESKEEEKRIFQKLIERRDAETLDEYDIELLEYYKKQGWVDD